MVSSFLHQLRRLSRQMSTDKQYPGVGNQQDGTADYSETPASTGAPPLNQSADSFGSSGSSPTRPDSHISDHSSTTKRSSTMQSDRICGQSSSWAPRLVNLAPNSWVHQRVLLVRGQIGDQPAGNSFDGTVTIQHHNNFPAATWNVSSSHFKALIHLQPGPNRIVMTFEPSSARMRGQLHQSWLIVNLMLPDSAPPLHLAILQAKDSPGTFDSTPSRVKTEGNDLGVAIKKFRMCAYLWQAFTADQMLRHGFGRRSFRFDESWQPGSISSKDGQKGTMRTQATVHVIRMNKTLEELRNLEYAQQYGPAQQKSKLYDFAMDAVRGYFKPAPGNPIYVSCLYLDTAWDPTVGVIRGHAALGGGCGDIQLGIFGSHCLYSYPSCLEEVSSAFTDCTRTDTQYISNDNNQAGSSWEAANIGIGAHLHETGHLLGCPHQENGIMRRDYVRLHRSFVVKESYSTATRKQGLRVCKPADECGWHRLDILRFRFHPCFRLPSDPTTTLDKTVQGFPVPEERAVILTAVSGIAFIEVFTEGDEICQCYFDYHDPQLAPPPGSTNGAKGPSPTSSVVSFPASQHSGRAPSPQSLSTGLPTQIRLTDEMIRSKLPADKRKKKLRLEIYSASLGTATIQDFDTFTAKTERIPLSPAGSTRSLTKLASGVSAVSGCATSPIADFAYPCLPVGLANMANCETQTCLLRSVIPRSGHRSPMLLTAVRVWHGSALDGIEFVYEDGSTQSYGRKGGKDVEFKLDTRSAEVVSGFYVRAGAWVDGIQVITSTGRRSEFFGSQHGGQGFHLFPPRGYRLAGLRGEVGQWVGSLGIVVCR